MGKDDDLFPSLIGIILLLIFFIALASGMSIEAIIGIIGIVVMILLAGWRGFYKVFLKKKLEDLEKIRKNHRNDIITILREELESAHIYPVRFKVSIIKNRKDVSGFFQDSEGGKLAEQHLKEYPTILKNWNESLDLVENINNEFEGLKKHILDKINNKITVENKNRLLKIVEEIIQRMLSRESIQKLNSNELDFEGEKNLYVLFEQIRMGRLPADKFDKDKAKKFLLNLINIKDSQNELIEIRGRLKRLNEKFDIFSEGLKKIFSDDKLGRKLKGKCDDCPSFWKL